MKELIALTVLLFAQRAVGQCVDDIVFEYGFEDKSVSTLMGASYTYCISAVCGSSPSAFTFNVRRSYESELPDQVTVFMDAVMIPSGFDPTDDPICITATAEDNDCLDSGDTILLEIQDPTNPPDNVRVADGCDSIGVQALDNDVIGFEIKDEESIIQASLGDDTAEVCVHITCVQAPTKRCAVLLFILDQEMGLAQLQKKIGFIPEGTESGDKVCCMFDLNNDREIGEGESVDLSVHVISQDANVYGKDVKATIRVNGGDDCDVAFVGNTPNVTGSQVVVELTPCVTSATCTVAGTSMPCGGGVRPTFFINRNTRVAINVVVNTPVIASPLSMSRSVRRDGASCDSHLVDDGFTLNEDGTYNMEFEGTGGVGGVNNNFICRVMIPGMPITPEPCSSPLFPNFSAGTGSFCVSVMPNPMDPVSCNGQNTRTFCFP